MELIIISSATTNFAINFSDDFSLQTYSRVKAMDYGKLYLLQNFHEALKQWYLEVEAHFSNVILAIKHE